MRRQVSAKRVGKSPADTSAFLTWLPTGPEQVHASGASSQPPNLQLQACDLINLMETALKRRLDPIVQEINMAKKPRKAHTFRYTGNEHQHRFNDEMRDQLAKATTLIENEESLSGLAMMKQMGKQLDKRNKLIRMADASDCGWKTVEEYTDTGLGSDSDDERKIRAAEERARKKKREAGPKIQGRIIRFGDGRSNMGYQGPSNPPPFPAVGGSSQVSPLLSFNQPWYQPSQSGPFNQPGFNYHAGANSGYQSGNKDKKDSNGSAKGSCFNCGSFGHWYQKCPMPKKNYQ